MDFPNSGSPPALWPRTSLPVGWPRWARQVFPWQIRLWPRLLAPTPPRTWRGCLRRRRATPAEQSCFIRFPKTSSAQLSVTWEGTNNELDERVRAPDVGGIALLDD